MRLKHLFYTLLAGTGLVLYYLSAHTTLLSSAHEYYGYYKEVNGLQESDAISLNGVKVGYIEDIKITGDRNVKVAFAIYKKHQIFEGTLATISRGDFTGMKSVHLSQGSGPGVLEPGSMLLTAVDSTLVDEYHAKIEPVIRHGMYLLRSADSAMAHFNYIILQGWGIKTKAEISKFRLLTANFAKASKGANLSLDNASVRLEKVQSSLADPSGTNRSINESIRKIQDASNSLGAMDLNKDFNQLRENIHKISGTSAKLNDNSLVNNPKPYNELNQSVDSLARAMKAFQEDPPGITVFGSKK